MSLPLQVHISNKCKDLDIPVVGFAAADQWDTPLFDPWVPPRFRPRSIYPQTNSVIVLGAPVPLPSLETSPSIFYHELYKTINSHLDLAAYRVALMLEDLGFPSISLPRDGYGSITVLKEQPVAFFSHRHAAFLAGLGTFGVNNMILTPGYGPRIRFTSVFTTALLPPGEVMKEPLCTRCMQCVSICPVNALERGDYPGSLTDKTTCVSRSEDLYRHHTSPCGLCIKVCPVGKDRERYGHNDLSMYNEKEPLYQRYHEGWNHVRSYGSKR